MLENFKVLSTKRPCKVRTIWEGLSEADREIYLSAISDFTIPTKTLERSFKSVGIDLGDTALNAHRKAHCSCSKI